MTTFFMRKLSEMREFGNLMKFDEPGPPWPQAPHVEPGLLHIELNIHICSLIHIKKLSEFHLTF